MRVLLFLSAFAVGCSTSDSESFAAGRGDEPAETVPAPIEPRVPGNQAECPLEDLSLGEIDVDFHGGHSNISGSVSITVCSADVDSIALEERRLLIRAFEIAAEEYWLGFLFSCQVEPTAPAHLAEWHLEILTSLNDVLGRSVVHEYDCRGTFAEAL